MACGLLTEVPASQVSLAWILNCLKKQPIKDYSNIVATVNKPIMGGYRAGWCSGNVLGSYSEGARFKSPSGHQLS
jgi:hypothetical protein